MARSLFPPPKSAANRFTQMLPNVATHDVFTAETQTYLPLPALLAETR